MFLSLFTCSAVLRLLLAWQGVFRGTIGQERPRINRGDTVSQSSAHLFQPKAPFPNSPKHLKPHTSFKASKDGKEPSQPTIRAFDWLCRGSSPRPCPIIFLRLLARGASSGMMEWFLSFRDISWSTIVAGEGGASLL